MIASFIGVAIVATISFILFVTLLKNSPDNASISEVRETTSSMTHVCGALIGIIVFAPSLEELVFRGPLLLFVSNMSGTSSWLWVIGTSLAFALIHLVKSPVQQADLDNYDEEASFEESAKKFRKENPSMILRRRIITIVTTFLLGMIFGYFGVQAHSLWVCFGIHLAWNFCIVIALLSMKRSL